MLTFYCGTLKLNVIKWLSSYHLRGEEEKDRESGVLSAVKIHTTSTTKTKTKQKSYGEKTKIEKWRRSAGRKNNIEEDKT